MHSQWDEEDDGKMKCADVKKGDYVMLKNRPCKLLDKSYTACGKYGHRKAHFVGQDLFTKQKIEDVVSEVSRVDIPDLKYRSYQLVDVDESFLALMDDQGEIMNDVRVPRGKEGKDLRERFEKGEGLAVTVMSWNDEDVVISVETDCTQ